MIEALGYNEELAEKEQKAVQEAIEARKVLATDLRQKIRERSLNDVEDQYLADLMSKEQFTFDQKLREINSRISAAQDMVHKNGQGVITMRGTPPSGDPIAQELYKHWMSKRWNKLYPYSSGRFSIVVDPNMTQTQKDATAQMNDFVNQADTLKKNHLATMEKLEKDKQEKNSLKKALAAAESAAQKALDDSQRNGAASWNEFKLKCPVEYGQITMLSDINICVGQAATWMSRVSTDVVTVESLLDQLEDPISYSPKELLPIVDELLSVLDDSSTSTVAFLRKLGGMELKKALKPMFSGQHAFQSIQGRLQAFQETEQKAIALDPHAQEVD